MSNPVTDEWIIELPDGGSISFKSKYHPDEDYTFIEGSYTRIGRATDYVAKKSGSLDRTLCEVAWRADKMTDSEAKARWDELKPLCGDPIPLTNGVMSDDAIPIEDLYEYQCLTQRILPKATHN
jgi:hypothetical protein